MYSELLKFTKTFGPLKDDFYEWHKNRPKYAVWVVEPNHHEFLIRYNWAQHHLSQYLIDDYLRKPHITISPCGFLMPEKNEIDDYSPDMVEQDIERILDFSLSSIEAEIKNILISYAIAPGFEVLDVNGALQVLHDALSKNDHFAENYGYFPHVTVGLYNNEWPTDLIVKALQGFPIQENIALSFKRLKLVSYDPTVSGGTLQDELMIDLSTKTVTKCSNFF